MKKILCLLLCLMSLAGCTQKALSKYQSTLTDVGFDTVVFFIGYTENEAQFNVYNDFLKSEFKRYDQLFDKYNNYANVNNIKVINDNAGIKAVEVDDDIIEMLALAKQYYELSDHQFDVTMGSVLNIWHDYREEATSGGEARVPSQSELEEAKKHSGWDHVQIDEENSTIYIDDARVSLDVGAVAKGFAVEKIAKELETKGMEHAIINAGGNVRLLGDKPEEEYWSVGVQIPDIKQLETDSLVSIKFNESGSFVTSGDYQRYYMYDGKIMHHIIDPHTLQPASYARSTTVICKDSGIADILSTTLYTMSYSEGAALLQKLKTDQGIEAEAIWVYDDDVPPEDDVATTSTNGYQIIMSDGLQDKIK